jgi:putative component of membrane protein insertase Oxa1/YidC/SpoIIIJ protein YidD
MLLQPLNPTLSSYSPLSPWYPLTAHDPQDILLQPLIPKICSYSPWSPRYALTALDPQDMFLQPLIPKICSYSPWSPGYVLTALDPQDMFSQQSQAALKSLNILTSLCFLLYLTKLYRLIRLRLERKGGSWIIYKPHYLCSRSWWLLSAVHGLFVHCPDIFVIRSARFGMFAMIAAPNADADPLMLDTVVWPVADVLFRVFWRTYT